MCPAEYTQHDRRAENRYGITAQAIVTDGAGNSDYGSIVNLSASGVMLRMPVRTAIAVGSEVHVAFLGIVARGTVKHITPAGYGVFIGIYLSEQSESSAN
jgi:hypothetical protein